MRAEISSGITSTGVPSGGRRVRIIIPGVLSDDDDTAVDNHDGGGPGVDVVGGDDASEEKEAAGAGQPLPEAAAAAAPALVVGGCIKPGVNGTEGACPPQPPGADADAQNEREGAGRRGNGGADGGPAVVSGIVVVVAVPGPSRRLRPWCAASPGKNRDGPDDADLAVQLVVPAVAPITPTILMAVPFLYCAPFLCCDGRPPAGGIQQAAINCHRGGR
jgi:hypothetical protein